MFLHRDGDIERERVRENQRESERERETREGFYGVYLPFFAVRMFFSPDTRLAKALAQEVPSAFPKRCREAVEDLLEKANEPGMPMWVCLNMFCTRCTT